MKFSRTGDVPCIAYICYHKHALHTRSQKECGILNDSVAYQALRCGSNEKQIIVNLREDDDVRQDTKLLYIHKHQRRRKNVPWSVNLPLVHVRYWIHFRRFGDCSSPDDSSPDDSFLYRI